MLKRRRKGSGSKVEEKCPPGIERLQVHKSSDVICLTKREMAKLRDSTHLLT